MTLNISLQFQTQNPHLNKPPTPPHLRRLHLLSSPLHLSIHRRSPFPPLCTSATEVEGFNFDSSFVASELNVRSSASLEVKELDELPEQWRRSKLAWLCKELPAHNQATVIRLLNAQRKWLTQEDATYVTVHCLRIRENESAFRVYKWMIHQHWFHFDHALATKLADSLGKERKALKCREIFDDIIKQGLIPSESTFHILTVAYLSSSGQGYTEEACGIYNKMIQLGGYQPRLSLHNALFRALVSKSGGISKIYLKQAEFIFHHLESSRLEIHSDIYGGLIWLHSYQDTIDKERISALRNEMKLKRIKESPEVLLSILRACSKEGDVDEAEKIWSKILNFEDKIPAKAFVYKMDLYSRIGKPMKSVDIFREMKQHLGYANVSAFHKIMEILCRAKETELAESLMEEFIKSGQKPLMPSYIDLVEMYLNLNLHDKLESTFLQCMENCRPNRTIYTIYLTSLVQISNIEMAEKIFNSMYQNESIGVSTRSCNTILKGYLASEEYTKAEKIYDLMCAKKYDIDPILMDKVENIIRLTKNVIKKPSLQLSKEQREILIGLLLGGLVIESDDDRKQHAIHFNFDENSETHSIFKIHIHNQFHEWLSSFSKSADVIEEVIPSQFFTIPHSNFAYYAEQFWPRGKNVIPKLVHRWLTPRVLAYWYMYSGYKTSSGDILLKIKGDVEGVERIVKTLKTKSLDCRVKRKGRVFWLGFLGSNSTWFWKLVEPFVLDDLKIYLKAGDGGISEEQSINFDSGSDCDD